MVVGSSEVEGIAGGELRSGGMLRWWSDFCAPVISDRAWVAGQLRKDQRELLVVLVGRKGGWLRRIAPELSGGRTGRSWRGWSSPVNLLLGELYGEGLMSRECSEGLGDPLYSVTRLAPRWQQIRSPATAFL